jgi:radical SAM protein with 4Fe4S-binding SPASM domain
MILPASVQFYPTLQCNQECGFCFNRNIYDKGLYKEMDRTRAYSLIPLFNETGITEVDILGGEPLLVPWLQDFVLRLLDTGITVNISTNGSLSLPVRQFADISSPLLNFGFSIHGLSDTHSQLTSSTHFGAMVSGIRTMVDAGRNPVTKTTLTRENLDEIPDLIALLRDLGVKRYYLLHEDTIGRETHFNGFSFPEFWERYTLLKETCTRDFSIGFVAASGFYKDSKNHGCRCDAGIHKLAVFPDGSVFPCNLFGRFPEYNMGNIFERNTRNLLSHPSLGPFRKTSLKNPCMSQNCDHFAVCSGGCPAHCYERFRTFDTADPRCSRY